MSDSKKALAFGKRNYILMLASVLVIALGFILMAIDSEPHGFGVLGLTVGPITIMVGFVLSAASILVKSEEETN
ncbi:DUF3098 domain-containing protein [Algivirga pacifica]|uniref:DUF3098 domain-containing protein n=1 Tax=Algivirga pacifica TaxID=1162670 RepID=A0ABP9D7F2_9BACT